MTYLCDWCGDDAEKLIVLISMPCQWLMAGSPPLIVREFNGGFMCEGCYEEYPLAEWPDGPVLLETEMGCKSPDR